MVHGRYLVQLGTQGMPATANQLGGPLVHVSLRSGASGQVNITSTTPALALLWPQPARWSWPKAAMHCWTSAMDRALRSQIPIRYVGHVARCGDGGGELSRPVVCEACSRGCACLMSAAHSARLIKAGVTVRPRRLARDDEPLSAGVAMRNGDPSFGRLAGT